MGLDYVVADVFTDTPLTGNQLAVFTDASDVDAGLFQSLARELNLSETVFVLPGDRVRIFTPVSELPFAGHPTLGTAFVLRQERGVDEITLVTGLGPVPVVFDRAGRGRMTQPLPAITRWPGDTGALFAALGVKGALLPVDEYDNGPKHHVVVLDEPATVERLRPDMGVLGELLPGGAVSCVAGAGTRWTTRMFGPGLGVAEDPATGSAAGPIAIHLCRYDLVRWGTEIELTQGVQIQRASKLFAVARGGPSGLDTVEVAGDTVIVGRGSFDL